MTRKTGPIVGTPYGPLGYTHRYRHHHYSPWGRSILESFFKRWVRTHQLGKHYPKSVPVEVRNYNWRTGWWRITEDDIELMEERYDS